MTQLTLDVRLDGFTEPVGALARSEHGALAFAYTSAHLARADAVPLSLSLPLTDEPYDDVITRAFFDNLLQERDGALADVMAREGLARDDVAGLLLHLGKDCAGALSVLPVGAPPVKVPGDLATDYTVLSEERLVAIATALRDRRRLPAGTSDPSPLAGVQSKIALTRLPDGRLAEPRPGTGAPTTHILKVPDRGHPRDAAYEAATLDSVACARLRHVGGGRHQDRRGRGSAGAQVRPCPGPGRSRRPFAPGGLRAGPGPAGRAQVRAARHAGTPLRCRCHPQGSRCHRRSHRRARPLLPRHTVRPDDRQCRQPRQELRAAPHRPWPHGRCPPLRPAADAPRCQPHRRAGLQDRCRRYPGGRHQGRSLRLPGDPRRSRCRAASA